MNKIALLAASALAMTSTVAAASDPISIQRQQFLDLGAAPQSLTRNLTGAVTVNGTFSQTCGLSWGSTGNPGDATAPSVIADWAIATGKPDASVPQTNSTTAVTGSAGLTYGARINPQGMAVGNGFYTGSFNTAAAALLANPLICPAGGQFSLGARDAVPGIPGSPFVPAVTEQRRDEACVAAVKASRDAAKRNADAAAEAEADSAYATAMTEYGIALTAYNAKLAQYNDYLSALATWTEDDDARQKAATTGKPENRVPYVRQPQTFTEVANPGEAPQQPSRIAPTNPNENTENSGVDDCPFQTVTIVEAQPEVKAVEGSPAIPATVYTYSYTASNFSFLPSTKSVSVNGFSFSF